MPIVFKNNLAALLTICILVFSIALIREAAEIINKTSVTNDGRAPEYLRTNKNKAVPNEIRKLIFAKPMFL